MDRRPISPPQARKRHAPEGSFVVPVPSWGFESLGKESSNEKDLIVQADGGETTEDEDEDVEQSEEKDLNGSDDAVATVEGKGKERVDESEGETTEDEEELGEVGSGVSVKEEIGRSGAENDGDETEEKDYIDEPESSKASVEKEKVDQLEESDGETTEDEVEDEEPKATSISTAKGKGKVTGNMEEVFIRSPVQLTRIRDAPDSHNVDTVSLKSILGDPLIKECWCFNYLTDINFVMAHFDEDVRDLVVVKIIHGFWKKEDESRLRLYEAASRYPNVELLSAYIPDPFGTHHSKMMVLFRHDDMAQVIIHTANMIERDWANMTQAAWTSPLLPLQTQPPASSSNASQEDVPHHPLGSGERFKADLLRYLGAYERRLAPLTKQLKDYDFSQIRAAFLGSAPSRQKFSSPSLKPQTSFGWLGLQEILAQIPSHAPHPSTGATPKTAPHIIIQISSIATLGPTTNWLSHFQNILARHSKKQFATSVKPKYSIIFPTPEEIRTSLDGWAVGASIHIKFASVQQQKQLVYLTPLFAHWRSPAPPPSLSQPTEPASQPSPKPVQGEAHRGHAAPHIKTYLRFSDASHRTVDWALVTSANLSKQAWGDVVNKKNEIWIQSWEAGVLVWPELFRDEGDESVGEDEGVRMVPVFGGDVPCEEDRPPGGEGGKRERLVGFRMPYDLPLTPYEVGERPWCPSESYEEEDWMGRRWRH